MSSLIKDMLKEEKPREKAKKYGVESLTDVELLALLFRTGKKNESVMDLSRRVLKQFEGFKNIANLRYSSLKAISGMGEVKCLTLLASLELGRRIFFKKNKEKLRFLNSKSIYEYYQHFFDYETQEKVLCLYLDAKNYLVKEKVIFIGTVDRSVVHVRDIFKEAIVNNAVKIICIHNHPSGDSSPSQEDVVVTKKLCEAGKIIGISLVDHLILGNDNYYSFLENAEVV